MEKKKHPGGRPTKYHDQMPQLLLSYFNIPPYNELAIDYKDKDGNEKQKIIKEPNQLPLMGKWCSDNDIDRVTMLKWVERHEEFGKAYKKAKEYQRDILIQNGLQGLYAPAAFIFTAKNIIGFRDKTEVKYEGEIAHKVDPITIKIVRPDDSTNT